MPVIAYVKWIDSAFCIGPCQPEDLEGVCENESAGLLLEESDKYITIALDRCINTEDVRFALTIPKVNISKMELFQTNEATSTYRF